MVLRMRLWDQVVQVPCRYEMVMVNCNKTVLYFKKYNKGISDTALFKGLPVEIY